MLYTPMNLTDDEISVIADRLDDLLKSALVDTVYDVYLQREDSVLDGEISENDILRVITEIKRTL